MRPRRLLYLTPSSCSGVETHTPHARTHTYTQAHARAHTRTHSLSLTFSSSPPPFPTRSLLPPKNRERRTPNTHFVFSIKIRTWLLRDRSVGIWKASPVAGKIQTTHTWPHLYSRNYICKKYHPVRTLSEALLSWLWKWRVKGVVDLPPGGPQKLSHHSADGLLPLGRHQTKTRGNNSPRG